MLMDQAMHRHMLRILNIIQGARVVQISKQPISLLTIIIDQQRWLLVHLNLISVQTHFSDQPSRRATQFRLTLIYMELGVGLCTMNPRRGDAIQYTCLSLMSASVGNLNYMKLCELILLWGILVRVCRGCYLPLELINTC